MRRPLLYLSLLIPLCLHAQSSPPAAVLEGNVVNAATNTPLTHARVKLAREAESIYAKVDADGHFTLTNLAPGFYQFSVESPGYLRSPSIGVDLRDQPSNPRRAAGRITGNSPAAPATKFTKSTDADGAIRGTVSAALTPQAVIAGKVTDPYGLPIVSCTIELLTKPSGQPGALPASPGSNMTRQASVQTDDRGEFRISGLAEGTYWLVANKGNGAIAQTWESSHRITYFPASTSLDNAKPLSLRAGETVDADVQIVRTAGVRIAGKLILPPGALESAVQVPEAMPRTFLFTNIALVPVGNALMNSNGPFVTGSETFEFKDVLPGKYTLTALTRDAASDRTGINQKPLAGLTREIEVGKQDMLAFDLALEPLRDVAGEVAFGEGCKAAPLEIRAAGFNPVAGGHAKATSGADGKFVLTGLIAGSFQISASWVESPGAMLHVTSIRLGDRDVQANGLDAPYSGRDPLRIAVECSNNGRRQ